MLLKLQQPTTCASPESDPAFVLVDSPARAWLARVVKRIKRRMTRSEHKREDVMRRSKLIGSALRSGVFALCISHAGAQEFTGKLSGFNEIGTIPGAIPSGYTGAVLSKGTGTATLDLDQKAGTITYKLTYSNVGTTAPQTGTVSQAHIHFGKSRDSGGVLVFFCTNLTPPAGVPPPQACPVNSGAVTGTWTKANIVA